MGNDSTIHSSGGQSESLRLVGGDGAPTSRVLFLGYSEEHTTLLTDLIANGCEVWHTAERISSTAGFDVVVSYGYRHILRKQIIESSPAPIINLHVSYLPWNRGAHPNFWAAYDGTPSGVSIHLIDEGVDTGLLILQKRVDFDDDEKTFSQTYQRLITEIEQLFRDNIRALISGDYVPVVQVGHGSLHRTADLPADFSGWDSDVQTEIATLRKQLPAP